MKVMAIGTLKPLSAEQRERYLPAEVPATLQLYLDGKIEQFWLRDNEDGVIFLMTVDSVDEADRLLKATAARASQPADLRLDADWAVDAARHADKIAPLACGRARGTGASCSPRPVRRPLPRRGVFAWKLSTLVISLTGRHPKE